MTRLSIAILVLGALTACASSSVDYSEARSDRDTGYRETQLAENRYRVSFSGRDSAPSDQIRDYALLRAAELTLLNNHDWFRVVSRDSDRQVREAPARSSVSTSRRVDRSCGLLGCTTTVSPAYGSIEISGGSRSGNLTSSLEIVMGNGEVDDPAEVYNASELRDFIRDKYDS